MVSPVHAYWFDFALPEEDSQSGVVVIGYWSRLTPDGEDVIVFNPDNPPERIKKGALVIAHHDDGSLVVYQSLHDLKKGDPDYDPRYPNKQWTQRMTYSEDTAEYRWFHHYNSGDLVIYNGRIYEYNYFIPHNPNTETERVPGYGIRWSVYSEDPTSPYWYRYKVYDQGDIVIHQGNYYRSLLDKNSGFYPHIQDNNAWKLIGSVDSLDFSLDLDPEEAKLEEESEAVKPDGEVGEVGEIRPNLEAKVDSAEVPESKTITREECGEAHPKEPLSDEMPAESDLSDRENWTDTQ